VTPLAPDLFERRFGDLVEIGRARLPALAPDWTDHNAHDPGITLIELLAWVAEAQLYSLSRRPRRDERAAYEALVGLGSGGTQPARGVIWLDPSSAAAMFSESVAVSREAVVNVVGEETPTFRPTHDLVFMPGRIERLETRLAAGGTIDHTATNERGGTPFLPFGESGARRDVLAMTFRARSEIKGGLWAIGVRGVWASGLPLGTHRPQGRPEAHTPPLEATLVANGNRFALPVVSDTTSGLLASGALLLDLGGVKTSSRDFTIELRAREGFARAPRFLKIEPNVIPIEQGRPVARELHVANGLPGWSFNLDVPGLRFAAGEEPVTIEVAEPAGLHVWKRTGEIDNHGPDDRVFALDARRAEIAFGNGINGRTPPPESQILVSYAVSDGERGNVARNRKWSVGGFEGAFGVNYDPIAGGAAPAGAIDQRRDARRRARGEHALVSSEDIAAAAKELPLLEVARAWVQPAHDDAPRTGAVTLVVMRADGSETVRWLEAVRRQLVARIPLGTRLIVAAPRYSDFSIRAGVAGGPGRDPVAIEAAVRRELGKRLSLTVRKPGVSVTRRDVAAWLRGVDGVKSIAELRLIRDGRQQDEIKVSRGGLPRLDSARTTIEVRRS
jgi:Baseplate J-like protein